MAELFTENDIEQVMQLPKWIDQDIQWIPEEGYFQFRVQVLCDENYPLRMLGSITLATGYYKYNLFLGEQPVRMLHVGKSHHNPNCSRVGRQHKHKWTDAEGQRYAYQPTDIDYSDLRNAFITFLKECKIELRSQFALPPAHQWKLSL